MLKIVLLVILFCVNTFALSLSSNDDYKVFRSDKYEITFTPDYRKEAIFIKENLDEFISLNNKSFGYRFDDPIKIVLISDNIQVPNAFSTQVPYNLDVYFNGGSGMNDYFSTSSWLIALLTHEMVHNYQTNAKKSEISKTLHKYLGNNYMPVFASIVPFFTLPNLLLPTALLEGNSVLNETLYNNGGRLYSGSLNAMKNSLIFNNKVTPATFINDHLNFPYTTEKYIVGGFYMQYLAKKHGVNKVNNFFYENSIHSINPFLLNSTYLNHFGVNFEDTIRDFVSYTKKEYKDFKELTGTNILTNSKDEIYLSKIRNKIYYITTDLTKEKTLNIYDINTHSITYKNTSLNNGKVFKINKNIYTTSSAFISPKLYKHGLFNEDNIVLDSTIGKKVDDIFEEKIAYIDIKESFLNSKLFVNDEYYTDVSSSSLFDKNGNIYYFKQEKNTRVLYKNKDILYKFKGYYSKIVDIKDDEIYFISNTKNGSTLYKLSNNIVYKLNQSDNIINAKILKNNQALAITINSNGYNTQIIKLDKNIPANIHETINIKTPFNFKFKQNNSTNEIKHTNYNELKELKFSMLYPSYSYDSQKGSSYSLNGLFIDPIMFNMVNLYILKDIDTKIAGVTYTNERYIPFTFDIYDIKREIEYKNERGYGGGFELYGPIIEKGRDTLNISLKQLLDDKNDKKSPTILSLNHINKKNFPLEDLPYFKSDAKLLFKYDRDDTMGGFDYKLNNHIYNELYLNLTLKGLYSNIDKLEDQRGVEIVKNSFDNKDRTNTLIEGIDNDFFVKDVKSFGIGFSKTFNFSTYFSKFPISLRRESIFYNYKQFELTSNKPITIKENTVGVKLDLLFFHKLPLPVTIKYIKNDSSIDDYKIKVFAGMVF
ncbi:MAG: hypothetical protein U9Q20_03485 [Campylobacterota bacterium]|nr:hypothetical protein [Campylobacterota bacterium]